MRSCALFADSERSCTCSQVDLRCIRKKSVAYLILDGARSAFPEVAASLRLCWEDNRIVRVGSVGDLLSRMAPGNLAEAARGRENSHQQSSEAPSNFHAAVMNESYSSRLLLRSGPHHLLAPSPYFTSLLLHTTARPLSSSLAFPSGARPVSALSESPGSPPWSYISMYCS